MTRNIIITGANNGIGLALTQSLLEMGDRVATLNLEIDNLFPTHPSLLPIRCDVTHPQRIQAVVDEVVAKWGGIDILINNACLALFKPFVEREQDDIRREFEVNYFGYLNMIRAVLPIMRKQKHGVIHNMSSGVGFTGMPRMTGYTSTKGAIESLTRTLALELLEEGITVNVMHPPLTRTKSASGFGVPVEMMADPLKVGSGLAKRVGSTKPYITSDFTTALGLFGNRHFPVAMGKFLSSMAKKAQEKK
jgi:NAD(P)-dependent dehydrogenase (short-subunit alcohol dehydrogenase family)